MTGRIAAPAAFLQHTYHGSLTFTCREGSAWQRRRTQMGAHRTGPQVLKVEQAALNSVKVQSAVASYLSMNQ